jgi:hypothetical protein
MPGWVTWSRNLWGTGCGFLQTSVCFLVPLRYKLQFDSW